ncbi:hypothetical protein GSI_02929 [Ganoderma sinense ZZ0214-1]|uniref:NOT2/NOT3/NOT5 C-terminal domain-containing protein n=1 Tax=Ganoderma sinense ZZ0214-1 TaxID=1077348 RepID=A0A2G8SN06_9APHY|nr:hypothetical protein GSI_02929 [Ganoderma sinense ZZ0214-1]
MHRPGNRPSSRLPDGQPPQRPPSLGPNPALGGPFRGPYPAYGMPQRNVMPGYPSLPNQRTVVPQPSPNFLQQRGGQNNFPYGASTLQQQQAQSQSQQQLASQSALPHPAAAPPQQQQAQNNQNQGPGAGAGTTLPPHLAQNAAPGSLAPSVSSQSELGLDPNDFPALGATPASSAAVVTNANANNTTSYASQAGTGAGGGGGQAGSGLGANQQRELTAEDFPALGVQTQTAQQTTASQQTPTDGHPPGLNGFQQHADPQHRQNLLGSLAGGAQQQPQQQPGLLNLGQQARNVHPGFQSDADKQRNFALKNNHAGAAAWNSPNVNPGAPQTTSFPNGQQNHTQAQASSQQPQQQQTQPHLNAPPGVPLPSSFPQQPAPAQQTPYVANGTVAGDTPHHPSQGPAHATSAVPQTPAQQVLMSPADRWGLLGLLALIKSADPDQSLLAIGTDLGTMGLDMQNPGSLYSTFITPWADSSAAHTVEPDFHLPACYNVQPPPPGPSKAAAFSDETLFFMFYSSPRDALQEIAAQELFNRNWRYHKDLRLWITKESGTQISAKIAGGEQGRYSYWDPEMWEKAQKDLTVLYSDLEEKHSVFGQQLNAAGAAQPHPTPQPARVGQAFQGISMSAM